jgi:branched-chain amino acid transport system permease protein
VLSGFSQLDSGKFAIGGVWARGYSPHRLARLGLGRTFQTPRVFRSLTTWENLQIGLDARPASMPPVPEETLRRLSASVTRHDVDLVPHGQRRLLEVLRVALQGAAILLLDEPAAGPSTRERVEFASLLKQLRDRHGKTVVLVEHDLDLVMGIADRITVLEAGRVVASGTRRRSPPTATCAGCSWKHAMLEAKELCSGYGSVPVLRNVSFSVDAGEIVLVVGENGAGKSTLLRTLAGFTVPTAGSVRLGRDDITGLPPEVMPDKGLRLVLDGHRVFSEISVMDNLRLGARRWMTKADFEKAIDDVFAVFPVPARIVGSLSET